MFWHMYKKKFKTTLGKQKFITVSQEKIASEKHGQQCGDMILWVFLYIHKNRRKIDITFIATIKTLLQTVAFLIMIEKLETNRFWSDTVSVNWNKWRKNNRSVLHNSQWPSCGRHVGHHSKQTESFSNVDVKKFPQIKSQLFLTHFLCVKVKLDIYKSY